MKTYRERVTTFGPGESLVGVLTVPVGPHPPGLPAVVIPNSGVIHHVGPNRLHVRLARHLARLGHLVLRFDLSGIGDSDPRANESDLAQAVHHDIADAVDLLARAHHATSFIVCGLCSGANNGFRYATADARIVGAILIDPVAFRTRRFYLMHYGSRLFRVRPWLNILLGKHPLIRRLRGGVGAEHAGVAPPQLGAELPEPSKAEMDEGLAELVARRTNLLLLYTGGVCEQYNYRAQFRDTFPRHAASECLRVEFRPACDHTFSAEEARAELFDLIAEWLESRPWPAPPPAPAAVPTPAAARARLAVEAGQLT